MALVKKTVQPVESVDEVPSLPPVPEVPSVPSLPKTTVAPKADPAGVSPVAPVVKVRPNENGSTGTMTKQDWADKDVRISIDAVHKSTLESPTLAAMCVGKNDKEIFQITRDYFKFNLEISRAAKDGTL